MRALRNYLNRIRSYLGLKPKLTFREEFEKAFRRILSEELSKALDRKTKDLKI